MIRKLTKPKKQVKLAIKIRNSALDIQNTAELEDDLETYENGPAEAGYAYDIPAKFDENGDFIIQPINSDKAELIGESRTDFPDKAKATGTPETVMYITEGEICEIDGTVQIKYNESEFTDMPDEITTLAFLKNSPNLVTLGRNGECNAVMAFEAGMTYKSIYNAYGASLNIDTTTFALINTVTYDDGGELLLDYIITSQGSLISKTLMKITVKNV